MNKQQDLSSQTEQTQQFQLEQLQRTLNSYHWQQIDSLSKSLPKNEVYEIQISDPSTLKYYLRFRFILQNIKYHLTPLALALTTFLLKSSTNNYYALMLRKKIINHQIQLLCPIPIKNYLESKPSLVKFQGSVRSNISILNKELRFMNNLLTDNPKQYHVWTYKKDLLSFLINKQISNGSLILSQPDQIGDQIGQMKDMIYQTQIQFIFSLLIQECRNYHAWDYRFWLVTFLNKIDEQQSWIESLIAEQSNKKANTQLDNLLKEQGLTVKKLQINWSTVNSLWSHKFNLIKYQRQNSKTIIDSQKMQKLMIHECNNTLGLIDKNSLNECLWNYLYGLVTFAHQQRDNSFGILLIDTIFGDRFEGCEIKLLQNQQIQTMNRFQLSFVLKVIQIRIDEYKDLTKTIIQRLKVIDFVRIPYYDYLLKHNKNQQ